MSPRSVLLLGLAAASFLGCRKGLHTYDLSRQLASTRDQWSETIARAGLVPIFPPREDVQVGDIYVYTFNPESPESGKAVGEGRYALQPGRWMQVKSVNQLLKEEYQNRPARGAGAEGAEEEGGRRLRLVAFPDFVGATLRDPGSTLSKSMVHNGIIPAEVFNLDLDPLSLKVSAVSLRLPSAESYGLSQADLLNELVDASGEGRKLKGPYLESTRWAAPKGRLWLRVVSEVYLARTMDITVEYRGKEPQEKEDGYRMVRPDPYLKAKERVRALNESLNSLGLRDLPGGTLKYINSTDRRVALRRTWERGIAVGFRGFTLEIDPSTGEVLHFHPLNTFNPSFQPRVL